MGKARRRIPVIAVVVLGILAGCTSSKVAYHSKVTLTPTPDAGVYEVVFVIEDLSDPANPSLVSAPRITLLEGQDASICVGDETSEITCTALVDDASGQPEAQTTISVKKDGKVIWSDEQTVAMSK